MIEVSFILSSPSSSEDESDQETIEEVCCVTGTLCCSFSPSSGVCFVIMAVVELNALK
jgi:hypothetical protein